MKYCVNFTLQETNKRVLSHLKNSSSRFLLRSIVASQCAWSVYQFIGRCYKMFTIYCQNVSVPKSQLVPRSRQPRNIRRRQELKTAVCLPHDWFHHEYAKSSRRSLKHVPSDRKRQPLRWMFTYVTWPICYSEKYIVGNTLRDPAMCSQM